MKSTKFNVIFNKYQLEIAKILAPDYTYASSNAREVFLNQAAGILTRRKPIPFYSGLMRSNVTNRIINLRNEYELHLKTVRTHKKRPHPSIPL